MEEKGYVTPCSLDISEYRNGNATAPFMLGYAAGLAAKSALIAAASGVGMAVGSKMAGSSMTRVELDGSALVIT
jgi:hypothetical protein